MASETAVIILNYNGKQHLQTFLPSVIKHTPNSRIIVADNGSTDDSVLFLRETYPQVECLSLPRNLGFAGGYNEALQQVDSEYFILLNSDVEVTAGWSEPLFEALKANDQLAAVQPKILSYTDKTRFEYAGAAGGYLDKYGYPFCRGRVFDTTETDDGQYNDAVDIFWATGACFAVRSELFKKVGGFDADFFAHMEEIDLCWRLKNFGYRIGYTPESVVFHLGGGTLPQSNPRKTFLNYRNGLMMLFKNLPASVLFTRIFSRLVLDGISGVRLFTQGKRAEVWAIVKAHFAFYGQIPRLLRKRKHNFPNATALFPKSVVGAYFLGGKKTYNKITQST